MVSMLKISTLLWGTAYSSKAAPSAKMMTGAGTIAEKGRQVVRKPATEFAHLRKKTEKARMLSRIAKKKR
jgi:hypothetical protein